MNKTKSIPVGIAVVIMWEKAHLTIANSDKNQAKLLPIKLIFIVSPVIQKFVLSLNSLACELRKNDDAQRTNEEQQTITFLYPERENFFFAIKTEQKIALGVKGWRMNLSYGFYHNERNKHFHFQLGSPFSFPHNIQTRWFL